MSEKKMTFRPRTTTGSEVTEQSNAILYALPGWGKTTQCINYKKAFGKGFIMSGESGLISISHEDIDYLPFSSWDGEHNPDKDVYSFRGLCKMIGTEEFKAQGYKWIALDSLSEANDLLLRDLEHKFADDKNGFKKWGEFAQTMLGSLRWMRDLPYHILVTALAKETEDNNGRVNYWPDVSGKEVPKRLQALFDYVFAGVRTTDTSDAGEAIVERKLYADEVMGYHGKTRDPKRRIPAVIHTSDVAQVIKAVHMNEDDFNAWKKTLGDNS